MRRHIMPSQHSCSSSTAYAFTLCIPTRAGRPGDTQNGRTYVIKCWRNDDVVEGSEWVGMERREGEPKKKKKADGRWGEKRQTVPQYVQRLLRLCASKGYEKHKHCQHASSVEANSQNGCTAMAPNTEELQGNSVQACCLSRDSVSLHL